MFRNYLLVALRNFIKNKAYSIINLTGLTIGMACTMLILIWVQHELSYDKYNSEYQDIYRITQHGTMGGVYYGIASVSACWSPTVLDEFPSVKESTRILHMGKQTVVLENSSFNEENIGFADSTFFKVFTIPIIYGDPNNVLKRPGTALLSKTTANKYFGQQNPIGKIIKLSNQDYPQTTDMFEITGVYDDIPSNSHFHLNIICSFGSLLEAEEPTWFAANYHTYFIIPDESDVGFVEKQLPEVYIKYADPIAQKAFGSNVREFIKSSGFHLQLQPITDIHLHSDYLGEAEQNGNIKTLYIFLTIAILILIIACINYVNITTSHYATRINEVGLRKTLGAKRKHIITQFILETLIPAIIALNFSIILVQQLLPILQKSLNTGFSFISVNPEFYMLIIGSIILTVIAAGMYPTLFLSIRIPQQMLRSDFISSRKKAFFKSGMVVFQFIVSSILIIGTITALSQINYLYNKDLGYNSKDVLIIKSTQTLGDKVNIFRDEMLRNTEIVSATVSGYLPTPSDRSSMNIFRDGNKEDDLRVEVQVWTVDFEYMNTLGIELAAGNYFIQGEVDSSQIVINESASRHFQLKDPVGSILSTFNNSGGTNDYTIIGVLKDFHYRSLKSEVEPIVMFLGNHNSHIAFKIDPKNYTKCIELASDNWNKLAGNVPFEYEFMENSYKNVYASETNQTRILSVFTVLAILISALGLYGLITFTVKRRTKEIGIRKAHGADSFVILMMIIKQYSRWILIALFIASPVAWYFMNKWLQNFAYHIQLSWWVFVVAAIISLAVCILSILYHVLKAARTNPVESLRYE